MGSAAVLFGRRSPATTAISVYTNSTHVGQRLCEIPPRACRVGPAGGSRSRFTIELPRRPPASGFAPKAERSLTDKLSARPGSKVFWRIIFAPFWECDSWGLEGTFPTTARTSALGYTRSRGTVLELLLPRDMAHTTIPRNLLVMHGGRQMHVTYLTSNIESNRNA
ncbi:hypothetical protein L209DRAFT_462458 [Thermothelomyces heterothallicus CBS 203.75]